MPYGLDFRGLGVGGGGLESPEKKHAMCGHREASTGVRTAHVDRCAVVAVHNETHGGVEV